MKETASRNFTVSYNDSSFTAWLSSNSTWLLVSSWLICIQCLPCSESFQCMLGGRVEVWLQNILHWFIEGQIHSGISGDAKMSLDSMNQNRLLFIQIQTLSPSMHHKFKEFIHNVCTQPMENRRGPTPCRKSHWVENKSHWCSKSIFHSTNFTATIYHWTKLWFQPFFITKNEALRAGQKRTCASARQMMLMMEASDVVASGHLSGGSAGFNGGNTFSAKCW